LRGLVSLHSPQKNRPPAVTDGLQGKMGSVEPIVFRRDL